ncbi:MAG: hypothetical protein ACE5D4_01370 [Thermodesulfobacteriota bacterium]
MTQVKVCPECNAEYFAHIVECGGCGVPLKLPKELEAMRERQRQFEEEEIQNGIPIKDGEKSLIFELHNVLIDRGYPCRVISSSDGTPGKCGEKFLLIVPEEEVLSAAQALKDYNYEIYPELKESEELAAQGKCPACGCDVGANAKECSDCGLILLIEGQEECVDEGCGDGGCQH